MKVGDRVQTCSDLKIRQAQGTVIEVNGGESGEPLTPFVLVKWDVIVGVGDELYREIPRAWVRVIPVIDQLAALDG